ncbi:glucose-6-phosphate dehydrogenase, partial [Pseudomonas urmiensis]
MTIPCDILVFGGTGDLALHKLLPALYHLYREARLNNAVRIIALARRNISRNEYLKLAERHCRAQIARNG